MPTSKCKTGNLCFAPLAVLLAAGLLAGCSASGSTRDDFVSGLLVAPGKYEFYNCSQLAQVRAGFVTREKQLEALMAKAGPGVGGSTVSLVSYRPEHLQIRGELNEIRRAAAAKNCNSGPNAQKPGTR